MPTARQLPNAKIHNCNHSSSTLLGRLLTAYRIQFSCFHTASTIPSTADVWCVTTIFFHSCALDMHSVAKTSIRIKITFQCHTLFSIQNDVSSLLPSFVHFNGFSHYLHRMISLSLAILFVGMFVVSVCVKERCG